MNFAYIYGDNVRIEGTTCIEEKNEKEQRDYSFQLALHMTESSLEEAFRQENCSV